MRESMSDDANKRPDGRLTLPLEVRREEQDHLRERRKAAGIRGSRARKVPGLVGLALSGGGIRSATFSLGILQAFARRGFLHVADYLSTVSGGGYIGSCLSSLTTIRKDREEDRRKAGFDMGAGMPLLDPDQIHHLRKHGDFLILRKQLLRREMVRAVGTLPLAVLCTLLLFATVALSLTLALLGYGVVFAGSHLWSFLADASPEQWPGWSRVIRAVLPTGTSALVALATGAAIALAASAVATCCPFVRSRPRGETPEDLGERTWLLTYTGILLVTVTVTSLVLALSPLSFKPPRSILITLDGIPRFPDLLLPALVATGALLATLLWYLLSATAGLAWNRRFRSVIGAMQGIAWYFVIGLAGIVALILVVWWLKTREGRLGGIAPALLGAVSLAITRLLASRGVEKETKRPKGLLDTLKRSVPRIGLALAVPTFLVAVLLVGVYLLAGSSPAAVLAIGLVAFLIVGLTIDFNRISLHSFYRDRLAEAYLQTEEKVGLGLERIRDDESLLVKDLHSLHDDKGGPAPNPAPYHLIQASLNLPGSRDLARKNRKSDHFTFSRKYCGSTTTGWVPTDVYRDGELTLASAMTLSGAAASSLMGFHTSFARAFAMSLFNLRLGQWFVNPKRYGSVVYSPWSKPLDHRADPDRKPILQGITFWPRWLWHEITASSHAGAHRVNLSDGGHTGDNLGLYPLLQRRCRLIIACDGERDPQYGFPSLSSAIRQIFTDENVIVDIDLNRIRPAADGMEPREHFVVGRITYPRCPEDADAATRAKEVDFDADVDGEGWLLVLKSSFLDRDEPAAVKSYAAVEPDFPHQSTADQFFDDDQFESYRALGEHIARGVLELVQTMPRDPGSKEPLDPVTRKLVDFCRTTWQNYEASSRD
jgi:hypothetical protein